MLRPALRCVLRVTVEDRLSGGEEMAAEGCTAPCLHAVRGRALPAVVVERFGQVQEGFHHDRCCNVYRLGAFEFDEAVLRVDLLESAAPR